MYNFAPIKLDDREIFKRYLSINQYPNSEYNFTTFFAWENMLKSKYAIIEDCLVVKSIYMGREYCYFPLGPEEKQIRALSALYDMFKKQNKPLIFTSLSIKMIELLKKYDLYKNFSIEERRDFFDYVYDRDSLISLSGKKLHGKRNHLNFFLHNYNYELKEITKENEVECGDRLTKFILERSTDKEDELTATARALKYRNELGLTGRCLYVDSVIVGVILAENHHDVCLIQIAKSDIGYRGASVALFKLFLEENLQSCQHVNFMEDLGLEGLRKAKLSYHPKYFVEKYLLTGI